MRTLLSAVALAFVLFAASTAWAHRVVVYSPVVAGPPVVHAYYAPAPVVAYSPVVTYAPVVQPAVAYSPVVTAYSPVVVRRPAVTPYVIGRGALGQAQVYIPGQPVRNALRFVTP